MRRQLNSAILRGLLASLFLAGLLVQLANLPAAQASNNAGAYVLAVQIDPADSSVWIVSAEYSGSSTLTRVTHYSADNKSLGQFTVPELTTYLGLALEPGMRRFYFVRSAVSNNPASVAYFNLDNFSDNGPVTNKIADLNLSQLKPARFSYNPLTKHFYAACCAAQSANSVEAHQSIVIDLKTNTITGYLAVEPVTYNPTTGKIYAEDDYQSEVDGYAGTLFPLYDLVTLDAKTESLTGTKLLSRKGPYDVLHSVQVNPKTGLVYVIRENCSAKCSGAQRIIFDQHDKVVGTPSYGTVAQDYALNETTNQLYSQDYDEGPNPDIAVFSTDALDNKQAQLSWTPMAVDQVHNRVFGVTPVNINFDNSAIPGLSVIVADGQHLDVLNTLNVREPDPDIKSKATPLAQLPANFQGKFFPQTGHTLTGVFLDYWNAHGGLAQFGYPLTEPFAEYNSDLHQTLTVQYFERNRFELHPENQPPYNVLLGRLGATFGAQTGPIPVGKFGSGQTSPIDGGVTFAETGHTLTGKFYQYWQANGGLAIFGLPLTEPFQEVNPIDGKTYTVQYFERNRFELHPEFAGTPYEVELGLLGVQFMRAHGWLV